MRHSRGAGREQDDDAFLPWARRWYISFTRAGVAKGAKQADARKRRRKRHQEDHETGREGPEA